MGFTLSRATMWLGKPDDPEGERFREFARRFNACLAEVGHEPASVITGTRGTLLGVAPPKGGGSAEWWAAVEQAIRVVTSRDGWKPDGIVALPESGRARFL